LSQNGTNDSYPFILKGEVIPTQGCGLRKITRSLTAPNHEMLGAQHFMGTSGAQPCYLKYTFSDNFMIHQILLVIEMKSLARLFKKDAPYLTVIIKIKQMFLSFPECLVQQASFGSTPSTLILSYLNHGITTKVWYKNITQTL